MRPETVALLRCPAGCAGELELTATQAELGRALEGSLFCPACERTFPIQDGIARMLPDGLQETSVVLDAVEVARKRSEMAARDAQVEDYDNMRGLALFGRLEIPVTLRMVAPTPSDTLLEAGCGTGRMTLAFAARCRTQISVDFSWESLRVCKRKLDAAGVTNVDLIQADVCALPFRDEAFEKVVSCQVLEHIPTPESRARMAEELARVAKDEGTVVLSAYQHSLFTRLFGQKEGAHEGGIYYYRFSRQELHALLSRYLKVETLTGALVYHYLARCRKRKIKMVSEVNTPRPERKATRRLGQRELSVISLAVILAIVGMLGYGVYRLFLSFGAQRDIVYGESNLHSLYKAMMARSDDWDGAMPPAANWTDAVAGYLSASPGTPGGPLSALTGHSDDGRPIGYVYNDLAAGYNFLKPDTRKIPDPGELVVLFERPNAPRNAHVFIPLQKPGIAQAEDAFLKQLSFPHYAGDPENATTLVLYANGSVRRLKRLDFQK